MLNLANLKVKILAIVVLYNCKIKDSHTLNSLKKIFASKVTNDLNIEILVFDNGPTIQRLDATFPDNFNYLCFEDNKGLAYAYNYSLREAKERDIHWMLLLDQDTSLPLNYFLKLSKSLNIAQSNKKIKAIVSKMHLERKFFSPSKVFFGQILRPIDMNFSGIYKKEIFAIGSSSIIRTQFINDIGGFNTEFWMDSLDRWIFYTIHQHQGHVLVTDIEIEHELSVMNFEKYISEERYKHIIQYEELFMHKYNSRVRNFLYYLRLFYRVITLYVEQGNKSYSIITMNHLWHVLKQRIFTRVSHKRF